MTLSEIAAALGALTSLLAVLVSVRALRHSRDQASRSELAEEIRAHTEASVTLQEHAAKLERAFAEIGHLNDRLMIHDKECARDKTVLAEQQRQTATMQAATVNRLDALAQQMSFIAKEHNDMLLKLSGAR